MELALTILLIVVLGVLGFPVVVNYFSDLLTRRAKTAPSSSQKSDKSV